MKRLFTILFIVIFLPAWVFGATETFYLTATGAGTKSGTSLANAMSPTEFNTAGNWDTDDQDDDLIGPNDDVLVYDDHGTIRAQLTFKGSGLPGKPITLEAPDGESPVISGCDVFSGFSGPDINGEYYITATTEVKIVLRDGVRLDEGTVGSLGSDEWDWSANTLYLGFDPNSCTIEGAQRDYAIAIEAKSYLEIEGLIYEGANGSGIRALASTRNVANVNITDCISRYNTGTGFEYQSWTGNAYSVSNSTVTDCTALENGHNGFAASGECSDITYTRCVADGNCWDYGAHGFSIGNTQNLFTAGNWTQHDGNIYKQDLLYSSNTVTVTLDRTDHVTLC